MNIDSTATHKVSDIPLFNNMITYLSNFRKVRPPLIIGFMKCLMFEKAESHIVTFLHFTFLSVNNLSANRFNAYMCVCVCGFQKTSMLMSNRLQQGLLAAHAVF